MRRPLLLLCLVVATLIATGCDWPQFRYGASHTGSSPDRSLTADGLAAHGLAAAWTVPGASVVGPVVGGIAFAGAGTFDPPGPFLAAYDAAGAIGCSGAPKTCAPLWTAAGGVPTSAAVTEGIADRPAASTAASRRTTRPGRRTAPAARRSAARCGPATSARTWAS